MEFATFFGFVIGFGILNPVMTVTTSDPSLFSQKNLREDMIWFWCQVKDIQYECNLVDNFDYCVGMKFKGIFWSATGYGGLWQLETSKLGSTLVSLPCSSAIPLGKFHGSTQDVSSVNVGVKNENEPMITSTLSTVSFAPDVEIASQNIPGVTVETGEMNTSTEKTVSGEKSFQLVPSIIPEEMLETVTIKTSTKESISGENKLELVPSIIPEEKLETGTMTTSTKESISGEKKLEVEYSSENLPINFTSTSPTDTEKSNKTFSIDSVVPADKKTKMPVHLIAGYCVIASLLILMIAGIIIAILVRSEAIKLEGFSRWIAFPRNSAARPAAAETML